MQYPNAALREQEHDNMHAASILCSNFDIRWRTLPGLLLFFECLLPQELSVLAPRVVDAALGLVLALPSTCPLVFVFLDRLSRVPVTYTLIPTVQELVVWHVVGNDIFLHLLKCPVGKRIDLDEPGVIHLDDVDITSFGSLAAATACQYGTHAEFPIGPLRRLDLGDEVVLGIVLLP